MAAPTNIDAATAVELGPLPNSIAQQVDDAGTTYTVWYKYTASVAAVINVFAFGDLVTYLPKLFIYESDGVTPILNDGLSHNANKPYNIPVPVGVTYLKVTPNAGNPSPANLTISGLMAPALDNPPRNGDLFIANDLEGIPAIVMGPTGGVREYVLDGIANGEGATILPNGEYLLTHDDEATPGGISFYNADSTLRTTIAFSTDGTSKVGASDTYFYALHRDASPPTVHRLDHDGNSLATWSITGTTVSNLLAIAPTRDDTMLYYVVSGATYTIKRWDLVNNVALGTWYTFDAGYSPVLPFNTDLLVFSDDTVLTCRNHLGAPVTYSAIQLDTGGTVINTYTASGTEIIDRLALNAADSALTFFVWKRDGALSRFQEIQISDGSILSTFDIANYESGQYLPAATATPTDDFGPPISCPFLVLRTPTTGTIIVTKVASPDDGTTFTFDATGLVPARFLLANGDSQIYPSVTAGSGYAVVEQVPLNWTQSSIVVSNDSPPTDISVEAGETVTVTVTNTRNYHINERIIRRLRRAPHITQEDKRIFVNQFQLILQPGVGTVTGQGTDPQVMLRVSYDAGHTWGDEQQMSAGELGHYRKRVIARQLGQARDLVFEVTVSDPVAWNLVEAFLEIEQGLH